MRDVPRASGLPAGDIPTANVVTASGGTSYQVQVVYTDDVAVNAGSIDISDITFTQPDGTPVPITVNSVSVSPAGNGTPRTATYTVTQVAMRPNVTGRRERLFNVGVLTLDLAAFDLAHGVPDLYLREVLQGAAEHRLEVGVVARRSAEAADLDAFAEHLSEHTLQVLLHLPDVDGPERRILHIL